MGSTDLRQTYTFQRIGARKDNRAWNPAVCFYIREFKRGDDGPDPHAGNTANPQTGRDLSSAVHRTYFLVWECGSAVRPEWNSFLQKEMIPSFSLPVAGIAGYLKHCFFREKGAKQANSGGQITGSRC